MVTALKNDSLFTTPVGMSFEEYRDIAYYRSKRLFEYDFLKQWKDATDDMPHPLTLQSAQDVLDVVDKSGAAKYALNRHVSMLCFTLDVPSETS